MNRSLISKVVLRDCAKNDFGHTWLLKSKKNVYHYIVEFEFIRTELKIFVNQSYLIYLQSYGTYFDAKKK